MCFSYKKGDFYPACGGSSSGIESYQFTYEQPGLLRRVTEPINAVTGYEYVPFGRLHTVFDAHNWTGFGSIAPMAFSGLHYRRVPAILSA
jgi:hypothetical protein